MLTKTKTLSLLLLLFFQQHLFAQTPPLLIVNYFFLMLNEYLFPEMTDGVMGSIIFGDSCILMRCQKSCQ